MGSRADILARATAVLLLAHSLIFGSRMSWAQEVNPTERATQLAEEAAARYEMGDVEGAIALFHEAMEYVPDPAFAFNLAQLYDSVDALPQAQRYYGRYLELYPGAPNRADVEARAQELNALLLSDYAQLVVTTTPEGAEITVTTLGGETESYGPSPVEDWVAPGPIGIRAEAEGYEPVSREMNAVAGVRIELNLGRLQLQGQDGIVEPERPTDWAKIGGWSLIGAGVVGTVVGILFWNAASDSEQEHNDLVAQIGTIQLTSEQRQFLRDEDAESEALVGNILLGISVAAIIGGVVLLVLDPGSEATEPPPTVAGPFLFGDGLGLSWSGRF